jgi:hypothetical protein
MRENKILKLRKKEIYKKLYNGNHSRQDRNNFYKLNPPLLFMGDYSVGNRNLLSDEFETIMKIKKRRISMRPNFFDSISLIISVFSLLFAVHTLVTVIAK